MTSQIFFRINYNLNKINAFTLAEILITLGIIGVVIAITMPALIANTKKQEIEARLKKFYAEINQAVVLSQNEYGDPSGWDSWNINDPQTQTYEANLAFLQKYFLAHLKTTNVKRCENNYVCVTLANGSMFSYGYDNFTFYPLAKIHEEPNKEYQGKNCFAFIIAPEGHNFGNTNGKGVQPYVGSWNGDYNRLFTSPVYGCTANKVSCGNIKNKYCTKIIQMNGWKIPKEYPIKF